MISFYINKSLNIYAALYVTSRQKGRGHNMGLCFPFITFMIILEHVFIIIAENMKTHLHWPIMDNCDSSLLY